MFIYCFSVSNALVVYAPERCGGLHVVTQASALFGPSPLEGLLRHKPMFAPFPQEHGKYISEDKQNEEGKVNESDVGGSAEAPVHSGSGSRKSNSSAALFDACKPLSVKSDISAAKGSIVVVTRGECEFGRKVMQMQQQGAIGVVVVNYEREGERLANMKLNDSRSAHNLAITIPSLMISWRAWELMSPCRTDNVTMSFTADGEAAFDLDYGRDALNWAMMRGMALWILFQCGVNIVRLKRRHSELTARADAIHAMPVCTYSRAQRASVARDADHDDDDDDAGVRGERERLRIGQDGTTPDGISDEDDDDVPMCAICLESFCDGDLARKLNCTHMYHKDCIDPWLQQSSVCPVCKREIPNLPPPPPLNAYGALNV